MNFSGQYLTYEEYRVLGGTIDITPFNILEFEARRKIDSNTQNRLVNAKEIPNEVKFCMFHLINQINNYTTDKSANIASENTDGYSVSYISGSSIRELTEAKNNEITDIIVSDLYGVMVNGEHLIYAGLK